MKLLCLGDSITDCGHLWDFPPLGYGYVHFLQQIFTDRHNVLQIVNCGIDGLTLQRLIQGIESGVIPSNGDIITVLIGINDISLMCSTRRTQDQQQTMMRHFLQNYRKLLRLLKSPQILLLEPFLFSRPAEFLRWFPVLHTMSEGISSLAAEKKLTWIPLHNLFQEEAEHSGISAMTTDGIHLTEHGHKLLAETLSREIRL